MIQEIRVEAKIEAVIRVETGTMTAITTDGEIRTRNALQCLEAVRLEKGIAKVTVRKQTRREIQGGVKDK